MGRCPLWKPPQQTGAMHPAGSIAPFVVSSPFHGLFSPFVKFGVASFMGYLKGKSSLMIYEQFGELKYKYRNREFWCRGYYVDTVGKNANKIKEYIRHQLEEDKLGEQLSIPYKEDPFTGSK